MNVLHQVVVALIASAELSIIILSFWGDNGFSLDISNINFIAVGIVIVAFVALKKYKPNPVFVELGCGVLGGIVYSFYKARLIVYL